MKIKQQNPPRRFTVKGVEISHAADIALDADEFVTFTTESGAEYDVARKNMSAWVAAGKLKYPEYVFEGDVPEFGAAFHDLYTGKNKGKMVVKLPAAER